LLKIKQVLPFSGRVPSIFTFMPNRKNTTAKKGFAISTNLFHFPVMAQYKNQGGITVTNPMATDK
jgi:hypothetical protein